MAAQPLKVCGEGLAHGLCAPPHRLPLPGGEARLCHDGRHRLGERAQPEAPLLRVAEVVRVGVVMSRVREQRERLEARGVVEYPDLEVDSRGAAVAAGARG